LLPIDDQFVEEVNLSRMVGATPSDVDQVAKVDAMKRLITSIDPEIAVESVQARFPAQNVRDAMKSADLIVTCVDSFLVREQINAFCRRHLLPLVDIGLNITTEGERLKEAAGQLVVVTPDSPCLRCTPLLSDAVLERERTRRPPGYDLNADVEGDPQVVSMNGVLAAEACNSVLDLITGYAAGARGPGWWTYDGRRGELHTSSLPSHWPACPACAELAQGDPRFSAPYADDNLVDD
jgi:molybdopterin/thiamine biosynthesis adenylyltransferase